MQNQYRIRSNRRGQRGMGMAVTMLALMGILAITLIGTVGSNGSHGYNGILGLTDNALQASSARTRAATSFNMAESGIQYTIAWLETRSQPPTGNAQAPTGWEFSTVGSQGQVTPDPTNPGTYFSIRIYPDAYNTDTTSPTSNTKKYLIESTGFSGGIKTILQAYVSQASLAQYLVLLNSWNNSGNYWVSGLTTFDGPVHDNNANGVAENVLWKSAAGTSPMFTYTGNDAYTTSGANGINWWKDQFNTQAAPQVVTNADGSQTNQWLNVAAGGAGTVHTGTAVVPFPTSSTLQKNAATGTATATNPTGVTLCPGGGVYVEGNVSEMALSATGTNNTTQVITITQGSTVQRVTIDPTAGTKLETQQTNGTWLQTGSLSGTTNGVVYVDGNIGAQGDPKTGGLHGVVADNALNSSGTITHDSALTIATPQADNANLDGSVTYNTERQVATDTSGKPEYIDVNGNPTSNAANGTPVYVSESSDANFTTKAGTLGLISNNVLVDKQDSTGAALTKFEMDGTVLASGIYDADHFDSRPVGLWENMGGYLSSTVGTFGEFSNSNLHLVDGFNTQFNYDARMRNNPPPFFPTTGFTYNILSWQQVAQPLEP
ncbi:MAG: pilus assembly PilX family protein [Janthinobacterium lividum]